MDRARLERLVAQLQALQGESAAGGGREAAGGAVAAIPGEVEILQRTAWRLLDELLRAGKLLRVDAEGSEGLGGPLLLVRGSTRLLDLSPLTAAARRPVAVDANADAASATTGEAGIEPSTPTAAPTGPPAAPALDTSSTLERVLDAMEQAQNLRLGDPGAGERDALLAGILALLDRCVPDLRLAIRLPGPGQDRPDAGLFHAAPEGDDPPWLASRPAGATVWIESELELPPPVRALLAPTPPEGGAEAPTFAGAVAVPLREPAWGEVDSARRPEAGLLIVAAPAPLPRGELLVVARRLSGFVTRRWRRLGELSRRIHTDGLTGVRNRAFFDGQFALELERARRSRSPLTLVLCDLDHFKAVNDRHGHAVGDQVLIMVAQALQDVLRRIDHVCRIGGEEFALVLPDTSPEQAREAVARVMRRLDALSLTVPGQERPLVVTLSCGVATFPDAGADSYDLFRKADAMLYRSKRTGRHRCHFWSRRGEPTVLRPGGETT